MSGKLIVIEGADGSGKATQVELLVEKLSKSGILGLNQVHHMTFPTYEDQVWGKLIKEYLSGPHKANRVDPRYLSLLYAADRGKAAPQMKKWLAAGDWIICDRYIQSNMAFQAAKISDPELKQDFLAWLDDQEYGHFKIPKADKVIYLSLPIEISQKRTKARAEQASTDELSLGNKIKQHDVNESDTEYLNSVREEYLRLAKIYNWQVIDCVLEGKELGREEIATKVWQSLSSDLPNESAKPKSEVAPSKKVSSDFKIKITRLDKTLPLPEYGTAGAAAIDLYARQTVEIEPGQIGLIPTNIIVQTPPGYVFIVTLRSSTPKRKGLSIPHGMGIIDSDYCGPEDEVKAQVYNFSEDTVVIERGERIAQGLFLKIDQIEWEESDNLTGTSRGGFGSTGR